ncbi:MAG: DUF1330 domain-containing protein [Rhodanobacteraceae bacterium]|nr:DUF1330 domain-containing protein [Rhodanobacteraceae bacterium]
MIYVINNMTVHDNDLYKKYLSGFVATFEPFGGKILAVQNAPTPIEGRWPYDRTILLSLPSHDAFNQWINSEAYKAIVVHRHASTVSNVVVLDAFTP